MDRSLLAAPGKPFQKERWAAAVVDAVGSHTLANALAQTRRAGVVAACGLEAAIAKAHDLMNGKVRGRVVVKIGA